jgi:hypothetical protein
MKNTKIIYWTFTILFAILMLFSSVPELLNVPQSVAFMKLLGYPSYINPFLGAAKILGLIAILVPGFPRIREWAYAGLTFDLLGATYSCIAVGPIQVKMLFMLVFFIPLIVSYIYYHKQLKAVQ